MEVDIRDQDGQVAASIASDQIGSQEVTPISADGSDLHLKWEMEMQGQTLPLTLTLTPAAEGLKVSLDMAGMMQMEGTGSQ
jgi:hypothetical protein